MIPLSVDLAKAKGIKSENVDSIGVTKGTSTLKRGFAHMLKNYRCDYESYYNIGALIVTRR